MLKKCARALVFLAIAAAPGVALATSQTAVLMVVSSHGKDGGATNPGYEFDEFAKAYLVFRDHGLTVDVASPAGGPVEAGKFDPQAPYNALVLNDSMAMATLAQTIPTSDVDADDYAAVFVIGGKGAMFDLPGDRHLQSLIADLYEGGGVVSAICHGPAALVDVRLSTGEYLLTGKRVNGFTNVEEQTFSSEWIERYPFKLEDRLVERGAVFNSSPIMLSHVEQDGQLITGQNPLSTTDAAMAVVRALGVEAQAPRVFAEDATIALITRVLDDDEAALKELQVAVEEYQVELVGMYGYYYLKLAENPAQIQHALTLMQAANEIMQHPVIAMKIIEAHQMLGQADIALAKARRLAKAMPDDERVRALLASVEPG